MTRRAVRPLAVLLVALAGLLALPPAAPAQEATTPPASLALLGVTGILGPGSRPAPEGPDETVADDLVVQVALRNEGLVDLEDAQVTVAVHPPVVVRSQLHRALDDGELDTRAIETVTLDVAAPVVAGETVGVAVTVPDGDVTWPDDPAVLPVVVGLSSAGTRLDDLTTAVVWLPTRPARTLHAVVVVPLSGETTVTTTGDYAAAPLAAAQPGSTLRSMVGVLGDRPAAPVVTAPDIVLIEELAGRAGGYEAVDGTVVAPDAPAAATSAATLAALSEVLATLPADPVLGPYAGSDVAALASVQSNPTIAGLATDAITTARTRLQGLVGRAPDLGTYRAEGRTTPAVIDLVREQRVLLPYDQTQGPPAANEPDLGPSLGQVASDGGFLTPALVTDPHVDEVVADTSLRDGLAARTQRLRAEVAQLWLEAPSRPRTLLVMPDAAWAPGPRLAGAWLDLLLTDPWVVVTSPREAVEAVGLSGAVIPLGASTTSLPSNVLSALDADLRLLAALEAAAGDLDEREQDVPLPALRDALLRSTALLAERPEVAGEALAEIRGHVEDGFGTITIADGAQITLTSETGELPVTLQRLEGGPINVIVEVESAGRLVWEGGGQSQSLLLPPSSSRTVSFSTRAISRGTFPVTVTVLDPTKTRVLTTATLSVRSTAISVPALWIIGALVVGLLLVGRLRRRPRLALVKAEDDGPS